ncbi:hypothetical protein [Streptomyces sp. NPDC001820]
MTEPERVLKFTARVTVIADLDLTTGGGGGTPAGQQRPRSRALT